MNYSKLFLRTVTVLLFAISSSITAQKAPSFADGQAPNLEGKKWKLVKNMSDEFNKKRLDPSKWLTSGGWIGRAPGLFMEDNISVKNGSLHITAYKLPAPITKHNKVFTHGGGYVGSTESLTYGYYECRMKANKTFMSSTFWLINEGKNLSGCDKRTVELDIQECVGEINNKKPFAQNFDQSMHANTHSRNIPEGCDYAKATAGVNQNLDSGKVYDDYHTYGAWWKSKTEVQFFLDGKLIKTVTPPADFDIPMHLRMVVETYDWNPVPADGGMTGNEKERTTSYDWVRVWRLTK
ncbi:family 16 glycosylhydrolase [Flavicella sediminum]|uniref:family 16 glycosylhydrolase n=1 Tax=Flavicella sediminum TaxID=2585141 RepID=UPI00111EB4B2|nr:family 16 glycosylhydrolase [Flavicella sediminum]